MLYKNRANRRRQDYLKAKRKHDISVHVYGFEWYRCIGEYDKGKIHCSCSLCAGKTNDRKLNQGGTHHRLGKKNWSISDQKKVMGCFNQLTEYLK